MIEETTKIYIVEDESLIVMELEARLLDLGYTLCGRSSSGEEALSQIPQARPDAIIMDIKLEGELDGIATALKLRHLCDIPVIFLTAYSNSDLILLARDAAPFGYLIKPFEGQEVHATIQMALCKHRLERALLAAKQALHRSEERNRAIVNAVPDMLFRVNREGVLLDYHMPDLALFSIAPQEALGRNMREILPLDMADRTLAAMEQTLQSRAMMLFEFDLKGNGERKYYETRLVAISKEEVLAIIRDITYRKQAEERLQTLTTQLITAQEDERRRIAREVHDEIGQLLTGLKLQVGLLSRQPVENVESVESSEETSRSILALVDEIIQRLRDLPRNLNPDILESLGLSSALSLLFQRHTQMTGIQITWERQGLTPPCPCPLDVRTAAYRIIQEALTNAARHSGVKGIEIATIYVEGELFLSIHDLGSGFSPEAVMASNKTVGLIGMMERARSLGGELEVHAEPGRGTLINATLPCRH